jgi:hypothetical protein
MKTKTKKITVTIEHREHTMVWYLNDEGVAVVADVEKGWNGWGVKFRSQRIDGYHYKREAVEKAKQWLRDSM